MDFIGELGGVSNFLFVVVAFFLSPIAQYLFNLTIFSQTFEIRRHIRTSKYGKKLKYYKLEFTVC